MDKSLTNLQSCKISFKELSGCSETSTWFHELYVNSSLLDRDGGVNEEQIYRFYSLKIACDLLILSKYPFSSS